MMNAELVHLKESKILLPTVYKEDYVLNLRKLTRQGETSGYIRMMDRIHAYSSGLDKADFKLMKDQLIRSNAFREPSEAAINFSKESKSSIPT